MRTYTKQEMIDCYKAAFDNAIQILLGTANKIEAEDYVDILTPINNSRPLSKETHVELPNFDSVPNTLFNIPANKNLKPIKGIAVDCGSVNGKNPGIFEYRLVNIESGVIIKNVIISGETTNNISELLAIVEGLRYCMINKLTIPVYSDSLTAIAWLKHKQFRTKFDVTDSNQRQMINDSERFMKSYRYNPVIFWNKKLFGSEIPADYGRKSGKNKRKK